MRGGVICCPALRLTASDRYLTARTQTHDTRAGMNLEELTGLAYQPWNGSWSFTTDTSVNYLLWATKPLAQ